MGGHAPHLISSSEDQQQRRVLWPQLDVAGKARGLEMAQGLALHLVGGVVSERDERPDGGGTSSRRADGREHNVVVGLQKERKGSQRETSCSVMS